MKSTIVPTASLLALGISLAAHGATPANLHPAKRAGADLAVTATGRATTIDVLANDGDLGRIRLMFIQSAPRNGSVAIVGNKAVYTPSAGFNGRDSFRYHAKGTRGTAVGVVTIDVGQPLVLSGKVTDGPIANATVQASVDGHAFSTQADADGNYSFEVIGAAGGMLTLSAQGTGTQSAASFTSVVGDFDRLVAEAGDGTLTRDENNQVQVTNVSTAQANLLQAANQGAPIADDAQLVAARESLDNGQLLQQAAAIKLVVDGGFALPAGVTDTFALISNPAALAGFLQAVSAEDPAALGNAINEIAADPDLTVPTTAAAIVGTYTLVYDLGQPGTISNGYIQGHRVTLNADGTGSYVGSAPNADPSVTWSYVDGRAVIVPNAPVVSTSYQFVEGVAGQVRRQASTSRYEISRLFDGNGRDTLAVSSTETYSYPDNPALAGGTATGTSTNTGIRDDQGILPVAHDDIAGTTRALWVAGTPYANANFTGNDLFTFNADGTGQRAAGPAFTWTIDVLGRLLVAFGNGDQAAYAMIKEDGRLGEGIAAEWRSAGGARSAATSMSMELDGSVFTAANAQQAWRSGFNISRSNDDGNDFHMVFGADGIGFQVSRVGATTAATPLGWSVSGGVLDATMYRNGANQPVHHCTPGINGCYIWQIRRWRPIAADGDRAYVIEEFLFDQDLDGDQDVTNQRANFYDVGAAPPFLKATPAKATPARATPAKATVPAVSAKAKPVR